MNNNCSFIQDLKHLGTEPSGRRRWRFRPARHHYLLGLALSLTVFWLTTVIASIPSRSQQVSDTPVAATVNAAPAAAIVVPAAASPPMTPAPLPTAKVSHPLTVETPPANDSTVIDESPRAAATMNETRVATEWKTITIRRGDTLGGIFHRHGFSPDPGYLASLDADAKTLHRLLPKRQLKVRVTADGALHELVYPIDTATTLHIARNSADAESANAGFTVTKTVREFDRVTREVGGTIDSSLFLAAQAAGISDRTILRLVEIFGWDVDFALDLRKGDRFSLIYEENHWQGEKVSDGAVIAAEFVNQGRSVRAIRHVDKDGHARYFTPEGRSIRRTFLRSPVKFSRISSRFSWGRYHPVLKRTRPHKGVDYAAPRGTPVIATADGRVTHVGKKGGFGRTVMIKHGGSYSTLYAHLSRYRKGLRRNAHVKQGQVVGYVGQSGLATGPHLHYEFRVNGSHVNPLRVKHPKAAPIAKEYRDGFIQDARLLEARLDALGTQDSMVAENEEIVPGKKKDT